MTWPQWCVAIWIAVGSGFAIGRAGRNTNLTSGQAVFFVLMELGQATGLALILNDGGFW